MVTNLPAKYNLGTALGTGLGQGLQQGMQEGAQFGLQQSRLGQTLNQLSQNPAIANNPYAQQLLSLAPLLVHPGGAQLLGEVAPVLARTMANAGYTGQSGGPSSQRPAGGAGSISRNGSFNQPPQGQRQWQPQNPGGQQATGPQQPGPPAAGGAPGTSGQANVFPQVTAPAYSAEIPQGWIENRAQEIVQGSKGTVPYADAYAQARGEANDISLANERRTNQQKTVGESQDTLTNNIVNRAKANNYIKKDDPEGETVARKFALEGMASGEYPNENAVWEQYVRPKMQDYDYARGVIKKTYTAPGAFGKAYRKFFGTYRDKEEAMQDLQKPIQKLVGHGLIAEAREMLGNDVGWNPDDVERTIFPFTKSDKKHLGDIPENPHYKSLKNVQGVQINPKELKGGSFPARMIARQDISLDGEQMGILKDQIAAMASENPNLNLLSLRGVLNAEKGYAWEDLKQAFNELISEGRIKPNPIQDQQMSFVDQAPLPGMAFMMKNWLTETR